MIDAYSRFYYPVNVEGQLVTIGANAVRKFYCKLFPSVLQLRLKLGGFRSVVSLNSTSHASLDFNSQIVAK